MKDIDGEIDKLWKRINRMPAFAPRRHENDNTVTWALAIAQLVSWGTICYAVSLFAATPAPLYDPVFAVTTRDYPGSLRTKITLIIRQTLTHRERKGELA